ncbi:CLUMA_CG007932, isoform A [Clunio marinus]|uniref:CLUMA_CG007932, isoform A n=1 Tax=Clunio marinus TaxID=568069 RepID=A0A1J1I7N6_9DIPT|nr:CLUMA_CG007932, isoform A [Clunio marinus]
MKEAFWLTTPPRTPPLVTHSPQSSVSFQHSSQSALNFIVWPVRNCETEITTITETQRKEA